MTPDVTIVIAAFDAEATIREALESVLLQEGPSFEIIVVDDGSRDGTEEEARRLRDPRLMVTRTMNRGVGRARNTGLWLARAQLVLFLDADDLLLPGALKAMVRPMKADPERVACLAGYRKFRGSFREPRAVALERLQRIPERDTLRELIGKNVVVNGGTLCIRTRAAREIGGFDPELRLGEDWEFWCRLAERGDFLPLRNTVALLYRQAPTGAQMRLRGTADEPNFAAVDAIHRRAELRRRFSEEELRARRRLAELDTYWSAARNELFRKNWRGFARYVARGAVRYPDSLLHWRLVKPFISGATRTLFPH